jgi:hypothetical protein
MTAPTTNLAGSPAARAYLDTVARELADLPVEERADLLEDLSLHLAALDLEDDDRPYDARLGSPVDYAAELRQAAGLPSRATGRRRRPPALYAAAARSLWHSRAGKEVREFVPLLQPAWWVARAYLAVFLPSLATGSRGFPVPSPGGSAVLGLALVSLAVVLSVRLGRLRLDRAAAGIVLTANVVLAAWALAVVVDLPSRLSSTSYTYAQSPVVMYDGPLSSPNGPVTDIYPYAADGTPLEGVLLYDQDGRPLRPAEQEWFADQCRRVLAQPRAADGVPVPHSFPQQYVLDPRGETLDGLPASPGQCVEERQRPQISLPVFPAPKELPTGETPDGDATVEPDAGAAPPAG